MADYKMHSRADRVAVAAVAAILLLLVTVATYLTLPSSAWADTTDLPTIVDGSAPAVPVYKPAVDLYVMPGREY